MSDINWTRLAGSVLKEFESPPNRTSHKPAKDKTILNGIILDGERKLSLFEKLVQHIKEERGKRK
jgi:hypothetical protein|nr:MAG TPA: Prolyl oligopeptidase [Caudoviricetes sp.]